MGHGIGFLAQFDNGVTDFGNLTCDSRATSGTACLFLFEKPHFPKEIRWIEIGDNDFLAIIIFQNDGDRPFDDGSGSGNYPHP
jgi:hypothetical protein